MTREDAIWYVNHTFEVAKEELCNNGRFDEAKEFEIAQNMAIEALDNYQNCVKCEHYYETEDDAGVKSHCKVHGNDSDLINRQAAIDKFNRFVEKCKEEHTGRVVFTIDDAKYAFIKAVESVEPVHGEWVKKYADELCLIATYTCSECGSMELSKFKYCPNCGAKMDKGGDTE